MNFKVLVEQIIEEGRKTLQRQEGDAPPLEVRSNGYVGYISTFKYDNRTYCRLDVSVYTTPKGKKGRYSLGSSLDDATTRAKEILDSWPTLTDTVRPGSEESIEFPFNIIKNGKRVASITKHTKSPTNGKSFEYYRVVNYTEKILPGREKITGRSVRTFDKALDIAFNPRDSEIKTDTDIPSEEECIQKGKVSIVRNNRVGIIKPFTSITPYRHKGKTDRGRTYTYKYYTAWILKTKTVTRGDSRGALKHINTIQATYKGAVDWVLNKLKDDSLFPSLYATEPSHKGPLGPRYKQYLQKVPVNDREYKYIVSKSVTVNTIAEVKKKQTFHDKLHNITLYFGVCANILLKQSRVLSYVTDFLHLTRGKPMNDVIVNTQQEREMFYNATVTNTADIVNTLLPTYPNALVYFAESTTSQFNSDVRRLINTPQERTRIIPKLTFRDLQKQYNTNPGMFFENLFRYPNNPQGKLLTRILKTFLDLELEDDVLDEKVSTTSIAKYIKTMWEIGSDDPGTNPFRGIRLTGNDKELVKNISWIMGNIKGPSDGRQKRIGRGSSIPPSFSVFHQLPKVIYPQVGEPQTIILIDDNMNRGNTYEAINKNIVEAFGYNVNIIWVFGAGIEEKIRTYIDHS